MHRGTGLLYIFLGLLVLLVSTAWSQKNNMSTPNGTGRTFPKTQATSSQVVKKGDPTTPMVQSPPKQQQPVASAAAVLPKTTHKSVRKTVMPAARVPLNNPAPRPALPRDPIVHARRTTPEPKELDVETTTSYYYNDYYNYNNYNSGFDGKNGSGNNQETAGDSTCPVFKETIMEHHVILRRDGCEIILSQDDALRWFGRPTRPLVYSRKFL
ncbi:uncharacterized protein LOC125680212 [Ostrea edulis]|uniref:uncharacterized protein LOC125680212 n=1 Tax=Ostrea edulis TaxID=37623 RepID=UPI0024AEED98|nr:uncharacterized protein LOC125680212 [Ostrea edulis]